MSRVRALSAATGVVVVLSLLVAGVAAGTATGAGDADHGPAAARTPPNASLPAGDLTEDAGDVVEVPIALRNDTTTATLTVQGLDADYRATVVVRDGNGDGRVVVRFDTYRPRTGETAFVATDPADGVEVSTLPASVPPPGEYALKVAEGRRDRVVLPDDTARMDLRPPALELSVATGPPAVVEGADAAALRAARENGRLRPAGEVTAGDVLVVGISASGLEGAFGRSSGDLAGLERAVRTGRLGLRAVQVDSTPERSPMELDLLSGRSTRVVADPGGGRYYLVVDTAELVGRRGDAEPTTPDPGLRFRVTVGQDWTGDPPTNATFGLVASRTTVTVAGGEGVLAPAPNQTVSGRTTVAPASELTVRVVADDVLASRTVSPDRSGRFRADLNLSGVADDTTVRVVVARGESLLNDSVEVRVDDPRASLELPDSQGPTRQSIGVDRAVLSRGGFVVVRRPDGQVLGSSSYLPAGEHVDVEVSTPLLVDARGGVTVEVVAYRDRDGDRRFRASADVPYRTDGTPVVVSRRYFDGGESTPTATATSTATATTTGTAPTTATPTDAPSTPTTTDSSGGLPGFGAPVALVAVLLALVATYRRR